MVLRQRLTGGGDPRLVARLQRIPQLGEIGEDASRLGGVAVLKLRTPRSAAVAPPFSAIVILVPCTGFRMSMPVPAELIWARTLVPEPLIALSKSSTVVAPAKLIVAVLAPLVILRPVV